MLNVNDKEYPVSNFRNHVAENTFLKSQLPPNSNLLHKFRNHVEDTSISESRDSLEENTPISESWNHVEESSISESRSHADLYTSISKSRDCVEENTLVS